MSNVIKDFFGIDLEKQPRIIYAYRLPSSGNKIKVGDTLRDARIRIAEQERSAAVYETPILLGEISVSNECRDYDIHKILTDELHKKNVTKFDVNTNRYRKTEWFEDTTWEDVLTAINVWKNGVPRPNSYKMRPEQEEAINKAYNYFSNGGSDFLFNCKMRFGKTFTAYQLMKKLDIKKVLILTYKPQVDREWETSLNKHIDFVGYKFYHAMDFDKNNPIKMDGNDHFVLFASFQDILGNDLEGDSGFKNKWKNIFYDDYDMIIVDEAHYGASTEKATKLINSLKFKKKLVMSGTPLKLLMSGEYTEENTYTWSYVDEQKKRKLEENNNWSTEYYKWLPVLNLFTYELGNDVVKDADCYDEKEYLTLNKFFYADKETNTFNNTSAVTLWLDILASKDERIAASPFNSNKMAPYLNVIFWYLPDVASVYAMEKMLKNHSFFRKYAVFTASGNNGGLGSDTLEIAERFIQQHEKVIILSCGKLNTGVTIPELHTVFMLNDCASAEDYWQTAFRVQSPWKEGNKLQCFVVDFNPNRCLNAIYKYAETITKKNETIGEVIRQVLDTMKVLSYEDNKLIEITPDKMNKIIEMGISPETSISKFESTKLISVSNVDEIVINLLNSISETPSDKKFSQKITTSILGKGKTFSSIGKLSKKQKKEIDSLKNKILSISKRIPTYLYVTDNKVECLNSLFKCKDDHLFNEIVGISHKDFVSLINKGVLISSELDKAIQSFAFNKNNYSDNQTVLDKLKHQEKLVSLLYSPSDTEIYTDVESLNQLIEHTPTHILNNPNAKIFDSCSKNGIVSIRIVYKLMESLKNFISNDQKRFEYIIGNMMYGYAYSNIGMKIINNLFLNVPNNFEYKNLKNFKNSNQVYDLIVTDPAYGLNRNSINQEYLIHNLNCLKKDGILVTTSQPSNRKVDNPNWKNKITSKYQIELLKINKNENSAKLLPKYDLLVIKNHKPYNKTLVIDLMGNSNQLDLTEWNYIPNGYYDLFKNIITNDVNEQCDARAHFLDKRTISYSENETDEFKNPCVYSLNKKNGNVVINKTFISDKDANKLEKKKSVIINTLFGECTALYNDEQYYCANEVVQIIVKNRHDGEKMVSYINDIKFSKLISMVQWTSRRIEYKVFKSFKYGFWETNLSFIK
jgi:superfamily II DNA or RNA helicase